MKTSLLLVIGNKKISSWSLRAWIGLTMAGVPFEEKLIQLDRPGTREEILRYSPSGRVPVLIDNGLTVHESTAILEYVNEVQAPGRLLPEEPKERALARSVCAEMHSGFHALRERLPMDLGRSHGPITAHEMAMNEATTSEISYLLHLWESLLDRSGGPFLFGEWCMADCMYLPVATRLRTYAVDMGRHPLSRAYMERVLSLPAFLRWEEAGKAEAETDA